MPRTIITLTTDFGLLDAYVAEMKAAILRRNRNTVLVDVTHQVPPRDVLSGSITIERAVSAFPSETIHLAVIDPGVGSDRRMLVVRINRQWVVCPDNGLITWSWRLHQSSKAYELTWRPARFTSTFHGRDIMGPIAAMLASGKRISTIARRIDDPVLLDVAPVEPGATSGRIIRIDHFGNAVTNIPYECIRRRTIGAVRVKGRSIGPIKPTYAAVAPARPLALIGSAGLLEIAVRNGSAARLLRLRVGDLVIID